MSGLVKLGARRTDPLKLVTARQQIGPRFVVLGDAAHTVHPNAAQGLNLALRDVAGLADCLAGVARAGRDPGDPDVLRRYLDSRRTDQRRVVALSDGLARLFDNDRFPLTLGRGLAMLAIDLCPPLKRALCEMAMVFAASRRAWRGVSGHETGCGLRRRGGRGRGGAVRWPPSSGALGSRWR